MQKIKSTNVTPSPIKTDIIAVDNLSDFALFLSVMREKKAYQSVLSIILDEDDLEIIEVHVENVILNHSGKRAIRLDAWAKDKKKRRFAIEMQKDSKEDSIPKRVLFMQSLLDSPILKSGKKTKYRQLPITVIIFITIDDIFGKDLARYTFLEKCEEVDGLYLEDGTKKIFLNMSSLNGPDELISLLQYMKESTLENPKIITPDKRIKVLDDIVREVKDSEEWEELRMNVWEKAKEKGLEEGLEKGLEKKETEIILKMYKKGFPIKKIANIIDINSEKVKEIIQITEDESINASASTASK